MKRIISLGAGVQSSTVALMVEHGELDPVECAIFSDTGAEPQHVYDWLEELKSYLSFPVYTVMHKEGLEKDILNSVNGGRFASVPFYTESANGGGLLRRQCTREYKIQPITKKVRELIGLKKGQRAPKEKTIEMIQGISYDEIQRMRENHLAWIQNSYPLVERRMTRYDCMKWMKERGYPEPPKSACYFCPYHDNNLWRDMKLNDPESFNKAVELDKLIRNGTRGVKQKLYLHKSMKPLDQVDFRNEADMGQLNFLDECEGMCGV